jgi:hypothetical protein
MIAAYSSPSRAGGAVALSNAHSALAMRDFPLCLAQTATTSGQPPGGGS